MEDIGRRIFVRIVLIAVVVMAGAIAVLGVRSIALLSDKVGPALETNATVIGERVRTRIEDALALGIPLHELVGTEDYLEAARAGGPGVAGLTLRDAEGAVLADVASQQLTDSGNGGLVSSALALMDRLASTESAGVVILPVMQDDREVAALEVAIDRLFVADQLREVAIDIAVLAAIAVLLATEMLLLVSARILRGPLGQFGRVAGRLVQRDFTARAASVGSPQMARLIGAANALVERIDAIQRRIRDRIAELRRAESGPRDVPEATLTTVERRLAGIGQFLATGPRRLAATQLVEVRGAAFLFALAEELTRPFLPLFIGEVTADAAGANQALLIAIPISAFMLGHALFGPYAATFSDRVGRRRSFLAGALLATLGLAWTAYAGGLGELAAARALSGIGYALTFVACQGHVIDRTDKRGRTLGMSVFVGGIVAADICGPAIGGILADQIGYRPTLLVAAGVALFAALMAIVLLDDDTRRGREAPGLHPRIFAACLRNPRLLALIALAAIPAKLLLTGFLFFLVPLLLRDLGASDSEIGRVAMIYGISGLFLMPVLARACDRLQLHGFMVGAGALLTGWALVPMAFGASIPLVALAVLALGVGQAMSIPAQTVLVTLLARDQIRAYGPGPVLGVFRLGERCGSIAGPLITAQLVASYGLTGTGAILGFGAVILATAFSALFLTAGTEVAAEDRALMHAETL